MGAFVVPLTGAVLLPRSGSGGAVLPGSKNKAEKQSGFPRNLGDPFVSSGSKSGLHGLAQSNNPGRADLRLGPPGANRQTHRLVPPSEGNEARREGRAEVVAP